MKKLLTLLIFFSLLGFSDSFALPRLGKSASNATVKTDLKKSEIESDIVEASDSTDRLDDGRIALKDKPYGNIVGYLNNLDEVKVINKIDNYYEIETSAGNGFVKKDYLKLNDENDPFPKEAVLEEEADIYNAKGEIIGTLKEDTEVEVISEDNSNYIIKYKDSFAYISKDVLSCIEEDDDNDENDRNEDEVSVNSEDSKKEITSDDDDSNAVSLDIVEEDDGIVFSPDASDKVTAQIVCPKVVTKLTEKNDNVSAASDTDTDKDKNKDKDKNNKDKKKDKDKDKKKNTDKNKDKKNKVVINTDKSLKKLLKPNEVKVSQKDYKEVGSKWDKNGISIIYIWNKWNSCSKWKRIFGKSYRRRFNF